MLEMIGYILLVGLFVLEITLLRIVFARQSKKELNTFVEGWDSTQKQHETVKSKATNLVINK
ncbi:hypothetical protein [Bacillus sp. Hm123]|uniref:hypothetical protein n=1 Tax=Bacillus sp. Hm123 TaxID=3450745 RepID=UPI003F43F2E3